MTLGIRDFRILINGLREQRFPSLGQRQVFECSLKLIQAVDSERPIIKRIADYLSSGEGASVLIDDLEEELGTLAYAASTVGPGVTQPVQALKELLGVHATVTGRGPLSRDLLQSAREWAHAHDESPVTRLADRLLKTTAPLLSPPRISFNGHILKTPEELQELLEVLKKHFGQEIGRDELERLIYLTVNGYFVNQVKVHWKEGESLWFEGRISDGSTRRHVGSFMMSVPPIPAGGVNCIARIEQIDIKNGRDKKVGIGSHLLIRAVKFFHDRKFYALVVDAREEASYFCSHMGFNTERETYQTVLARFVKYLHERDYMLTEEQKYFLSDREDITKIADFQIRDYKIGQEFLLQSFRDEPLRVFFWLRSSYPGWVRLVSNIDKTIRMAPPEWEGLKPATRELLFEDADRFNSMPRLMISDGEHAMRLLERINNWASLPQYLLDKKEMHIEGEDFSDQFRESIDAVVDILQMIARDTHAPLFFHFKRIFLQQGRLVPLLKTIHEKYGFKIPPVFLELFPSSGE